MNMSLRGFATINYWADDVPEAAAWWTELLGTPPYFERKGPEGTPVYVEFRVGDLQAEVGIVDGRFRPDGASTGTGPITYWAVDDVAATHDRLLELGAQPHEPVTPRGDAGFITASVIDPFGNLVGVMENPHYDEVVARLAR